MTADAVERANIYAARHWAQNGQERWMLRHGRRPWPRCYYAEVSCGFCGAVVGEVERDEWRADLRDFIAEAIADGLVEYHLPFCAGVQSQR